MQKKINLIIIISVLSTIFALFLITNISATPFYYKISLDYNKGNIDIKSVDIQFSNDEIKNLLNPNYFKTYRAEVSSGNQVLNQIDFSVPNRAIYDTVGLDKKINGSYIKILENFSFEIYAPYYQNAKEIIIYNENNKELVKADVSQYSKITEQTTGVRVIGGDKDEHGCLISAGYSWCEEKKKCLRTWEEECSSSKETGNVSSNILDNLGNYWWVLAVILVILIIILVYPRKKKKK